MSSYDDQLRVLRRQEEVQAELETCTDDMDRCLRLRFEYSAFPQTPPILFEVMW